MDRMPNANCTLNDKLEKRSNKCQSVSMELLSTLSNDGHPNANSTLLNNNPEQSKKCCKCKTAAVKQLFDSCTDRQHNATKWHLEQNKTCKCKNSMNSSFLSPCEEEPNTKSTFINGILESTPKNCKSKTTSTKHFNTSQNDSTPHSPLTLLSQKIKVPTKIYDIPGYSVGHISHIPRAPPAPINVTMPSVLNRSFKTCSINQNEESFIGMIALKENDVCYTSGTIEWVGRKRNYPLNSGFKVIKSPNSCSKPNVKKNKKSDNTYTIETDQRKECECPDVLPTVSAIINHLDALHEAVDIVDLRLNNLESTVSGYQE